MFPYRIHDMRRAALTGLVLISVLLVPTAVGLAADQSEAATTGGPTRFVDSEPTTTKGYRTGQDATALPRPRIAGQEPRNAAGTDIRLTTELRLTPDRPGEVSAVFRFEVPDRVTDLTVQLPERTTVVSAEGFTREDRRTYAWDKETTSPTVTVRVEANLTATDARLQRETGMAPKTALIDRSQPMQLRDDGFLFVDVGAWALVRRPQPGVSWRYRGEVVGLERTATVDGPGRVGGTIAFLGEHRTVTRTAHNQTLRLVIPRSASVKESPESVLDSLSDASNRLRVGDRDRSVLFIAAPEGVGWAVRGLQAGDADAWVRAGEPLDSADNPWLHEYVHTRQAFKPTRETRWTVEGTADYLAAYLAFHQGRISFREFREHLSRGTGAPQAQAVLADPATWTNAAQYTKGALVAGEIDRRIRLASEGEATLFTVVSEMNAAGNSVTESEFRAFVAEAGGEKPAEATDRFTKTETVPEPWDAESHQEAFGTDPALVTYRVAPTGIRIIGEYRNTTTSAKPIPTVVTGETVVIPTSVSNVGGTTGDYRITLSVNGDRLNSTSGRIVPNTTITERMTYTADEPGEYTVLVRGERFLIRVQEPATLTVTMLEANRSRVTGGGSIELTATVSNGADRPGATVFPIRIDGEPVAERSVRLAPGESTTFSATVRLTEAGTHTVSVGDRQLDVVVDSRNGSSTVASGFGAVTAMIALVLITAARLLPRRF